MKSEAAVQAEIRVRASELGVQLWRNNNGACTDDTGRVIRYGLGNDSPKISRRIKSSDLVGWAPGGRFVSVECKHEGWSYRPGTDDRADAQKRWIDLVVAGGGLAGFAASVEEFELIIGKR